MLDFFHYSALYRCTRGRDLLYSSTTVAAYNYIYSTLVRLPVQLSSAAKHAMPKKTLVHRSPGQVGELLLAISNTDLILLVYLLARNNPYTQAIIRIVSTIHGA